MRYSIRSAVALTCALSLGLPLEAGQRVRVSAKGIREDIRYLASPELAGRGTGTPGLDKAAEYIAGQFSRAGLKPLNGGFQQRFTVTVEASLGPGNALVCESCGSDTDLQVSRDFVPFSFSGSGSVTGNLVFAGYGITADEYDYDDYAGIDAKGKIVIILRHEPQEYDSASPFEGRVYTEHSQMYRKALNAKAHGAAAILFVNDTANHSGTNGLETFSSLVAPGSTGIPFFHVHSDEIEKWFIHAGKNFRDLQSGIDHRLEPASFEFPDHMRATLTAAVTNRQQPVPNVVGYLPGTTNEYVVIGAHYDHLGLGEQYSLAPDQTGTIHPGADDNASGTAALLALARWFGAQPKIKRGVVFIAFAGEEIGLLGSTHYTAHPALPLSDAVAMINMDMIGRLRERKLTVGATASGEGLRTLITELGRNAGLELQTDDQAVYGSSDHTTFQARQIPSLFFFTGLHADYHRPTDTAERIDPKATAQVVNFIGTVARELAERPGRIRPVIRPRPSQ